MDYGLTVTCNNSELISKHNQHDVTLHNLFISVKCSIYFRRYLRPSSGAQKLYIQHRVLVKYRTYISKCNQQDATLHNLFISVKCSTCFRRYLRPSSGAQKLYIQHRVLVKYRRYISKCNQQDATLHNLFISVKSSTCFRRCLRPSSGAKKLHIQHRVLVKSLLLSAAIVEELELSYTWKSICDAWTHERQIQNCF
jgi:hypothetical protein